MPNITIAVPIDLKKKMNQFKEINWSEVARQAIQQKINALALLNTMLADSELTEKDISTAAQKIKKAVLKRHQIK